MNESLTMAVITLHNSETNTTAQVESSGSVFINGETVAHHGTVEKAYKALTAAGYTKAGGRREIPCWTEAHKQAAKLKALQPRRPSTLSRYPDINWSAIKP